MKDGPFSADQFVTVIRITCRTSVRSWQHRQTGPVPQHSDHGLFGELGNHCGFRSITSAHCARNCRSDQQVNIRASAGIGLQFAPH